MYVEYIGWFGLSWQEKIAKSMYQILGSDYKSSMKAFTQPGGWNVNLINTLYNFYILGKGKATTKEELSKLTENDTNITQAFLISLKDNAIKGNIDYKLYDPETIIESDVVKQKLLTSPTVKSISTYAKIGLGLIGGLIILSTLQYIPKGAR